MEVYMKEDSQMELEKEWEKLNTKMEQKKLETGEKDLDRESLSALTKNIL